MSGAIALALWNKVLEECYVDFSVHNEEWLIVDGRIHLTPEEKAWLMAFDAGEDADAAGDVCCGDPGDCGGCA